MGDKSCQGEAEAEVPPCSLSPLHPVTQIWGRDQLTLTYPRDGLGGRAQARLSIPATVHVGLSLRAEDPGSLLPRQGSCRPDPTNQKKGS